MHVHARERLRESWRVAQLVAECARAGRALPGLRIRVAALMAEGDPELELQSDLEAGARGRCRHARAQRESAACVSFGLTVREHARGVLRGDCELDGGAVHVARGLEQQGELRRDLVDTAHVKPQQAVGDAGAQGSTPARRQRRVEHVLIQHVGEPIADRERAVRQLPLVEPPDEGVDGLEAR